MKERIEEILTKYSLTSAQFADLIGVQRSSISHILSGRNKPSFDFIHKILTKYPEIDAQWLITGMKSVPGKDTNNTGNTVTEEGNNLFNQIPDNKTIIPSNIDLDKPEYVKKSSTEKTAIDVLNNEVTNVNSVKSVIFIYEDDTFKIFNSR